MLKFVRHKVCKSLLIYFKNNYFPLEMLFLLENYTQVKVICWKEINLTEIKQSHLVEKININLFFIVKTRDQITI